MQTTTYPVKFHKWGLGREETNKTKKEEEEEYYVSDGISIILKNHKLYWEKNGLCHDYLD